MHSFKEIVARLVIVASVVIIVETRARYIYQPGPFVECQKQEIPCGGHSQESCNEYCEENGFFRGFCGGHCCLCFARNDGLLPWVLRRQHSVDSRFSTPATPLNSVIGTKASTPEAEVKTATTKPKRSASISSNGIISKSTTVSFSSSITNNGLPVTSTQVKEIPKTDCADNVCLTKSCVKTANAILDNLDETISPCDDFYQFACGNFQKDQRIPDDKGAVTLMGSINDRLTEQLREMLEDPLEHLNSQSHSSRLAKTLYDSCMNTDLLEQSGLMPLKNLLTSLGGWPVLEGKDWSSVDWSWEKTVASFRQHGLTADYLLKVSVVNDLKNPSIRTLHIGEPALAFSREQLRNPHFSGAYRRFQNSVAVLLGADSVQSDVDMAKVFEFERTLVNISLPRELSRAHPLNFYHPITIKELQTRFPSVNWLTYMAALLPANVDIDENQIVNIHVPDQLSTLLATIDKTDKRTLANYMLWRASSAVLSYLNENAVKIQQNFVGALSGRRQRKPRWRECIDITSKTLGQAVGAMYVRKHFDETSREVAFEMVDDIRKAFVQILSTMDWMDEGTRTRALEKVSAMKTHMGYPKEILDEENLKTLYNGLQLSPNNFFGNILNLTKGATDYGMGKLLLPVKKDDWMQFGKPAMVNAFYQPNTNSIQFPAGILQGHFFDKNRPSFMNYGSIGWVIGHEITHGYDDQGSHFDLNGELKDWWNPATKQHFREKAKCLVDQYGTFTFKDTIRNITIPINGAISVGENIADNGGIKQAYAGYQAWVQRNGEEKKLPGLKYTPNQLFWISAANNWCSKIRPQQMVEAISMGVHSPGEYRVRGTFANLEQFSKDFSCPVGSRMNPPTKCNVW